MLHTKFKLVNFEPEADRTPESKSEPDPTRETRTQF